MSRNNGAVPAPMQLRLMLALRCACWSCARTRDDRSGDRLPLVLDHCHHTGLVRGVLCDGCNKGLGRLREDGEIIRAAAAYLERPPILPGARYRRRMPVEAKAELLSVSGPPACAICRDPTSLDALQPDHDHRTMWIRGLLCGGCNVALGYLGDDPTRVRALLSYLSRCERLFALSGRLTERRALKLNGIDDRGPEGVLEAMDPLLRARWDLPIDYAAPRLARVPRQEAHDPTDLAHSFLEQFRIRPGILWAGLAPDDVLGVAARAGVVSTAALRNAEAA